MASFLDIINTASAAVSLMHELAPKQKRKRNPSMKKLNASQVRAEFNRWWRDRVRNVPAYANDVPAKRQAFSVFVDELAMDDRITDHVARTVTMSDKVNDNPRGRSKRGVTRPSQKTGKAPSRRLIKRRKATRNAPAGFFANPVEIDALREQGTYGRVSETILLNKLAELLKLIKAPAYPAIGSLAFDMSYGGYQLVQIANEGLAESNLSPRFKAGEMAIFLDGAIMVARAVR